MLSYSKRAQQRGVAAGDENAITYTSPGEAIERDKAASLLKAIGDYFMRGATHAPAHNEGRIAVEGAGKFIGGIAGMVHAGVPMDELAERIERNALSFEGK